MGLRTLRTVKYASNFVKFNNVLIDEEKCTTLGNYTYDIGIERGLNKKSFSLGVFSRYSKLLNTIGIIYL